MSALLSPQAAFRTCALGGYGAGVAVACTVAIAGGRSAAVVLVLAGVGAAVFLVQSAAMQTASGHGRLVAFHHVVAVLAACALVLALLEQPLLAYLDAVALGLGTMLVCGRVGCLLVGCCHGRPAARGVRYGAEHVRAGFPPYLCGVRVLPVQALESALLLLIVAGGAAMLAAGAAPGFAAAWFLSGYSLARFGLEFLRGDAARPYRGGLSEPQWLALALAALVAAAGLADAVPSGAPHAIATAALVLGASGVALRRHSRRGLDARLLAPSHLHELAAALDGLAGMGGVQVRETSEGVRLSRGRDHVSLSRRRRRLSTREARALASLIVRLSEGDRGGRLVAGPAGVFHLVLDPEAPPTRAVRAAALVRT